MNFKAATSRLGLTASELAAELAKGLRVSVSAQWIRQARMDPGNAGYRSPPEGWERVVSRLAQTRGQDLQELADELGDEAPGSPTE